MNTVPYEIIAAPFSVYIAAVGTAFPAIDAAPGAGWTLVGTSGDLNYLDEGVIVEHSQSQNLFRALGDCGSRKVFRTEEDLKVRLSLADVSLEQYRIAINRNTVTTTPAALGTGGFRTLPLSRNFPVDTVALLVRGPGVSPYGSDWNMQYEVPRAAQTGNPTVIYRKGEPAALALEWTALVDAAAAIPEERFGRLIAQDADAIT